MARELVVDLLEEKEFERESIFYVNATQGITYECT